jgi:aspartate carbamoyltransferase regulatory subunit
MDISLDDTYINKKNIDHLSSSHPQKIINKTKMSKRKKKKKIKKIGGVVGVVLLYP